MEGHPRLAALEEVVGATQSEASTPAEIEDSRMRRRLKLTSATVATGVSDGELEVLDDAFLTQRAEAHGESTTSNQASIEASDSTMTQYYTDLQQLFTGQMSVTSELYGTSTADFQAVLGTRSSYRIAAGARLEAFEELKEHGAAAIAQVEEGGDGPPPKAKDKKKGKKK